MERKKLDSSLEIQTINLMADSRQLPDLKDVVSRRDVGDVNPLTIDVGAVGVVTTWTQALHTHTHTIK